MLSDRLFHKDVDGKRIPHRVNPGPQLECSQCGNLRAGADFVGDDGTTELTVCCYCASKNAAEFRDQEAAEKHEQDMIDQANAFDDHRDEEEQS